MRRYRHRRSSSGKCPEAVHSLVRLLNGLRPTTTSVEHDHEGFFLFLMTSKGTLCVVCFSVYSYGTLRGYLHCISALHKDVSKCLIRSYLYSATIVCSQQNLQVLRMMESKKHWWSSHVREKSPKNDFMAPSPKCVVHPKGSATTYLTYVMRVSMSACDPLQPCRIFWCVSKPTLWPSTCMVRKVIKILIYTTRTL